MLGSASKSAESRWKKANLSRCVFLNAVGCPARPGRSGALPISRVSFQQIADGNSFSVSLETLWKKQAARLAELGAEFTNGENDCQGFRSFCAALPLLAQDRVLADGKFTAARTSVMLTGEAIW